MTHIWLALLVLPALCTVAMAQDGAGRTSPSELLGNAALFNGKPITISGTVLNLREGVSTAGKGYYTFDLSDGTEAVHVFSTGKARCKAGRATVDGRSRESGSRSRRRGSGVAERRFVPW